MSIHLTASLLESSESPDAVAVVKIISDMPEGWEKAYLIIDGKRVAFFGRNKTAMFVPKIFGLINCQAYVYNSDGSLIILQDEICLKPDNSNIEEFKNIYLM